MSLRKNNSRNILYNLKIVDLANYLLKFLFSTFMIDSIVVHSYSLPSFGDNFLFHVKEKKTKKRLDQRDWLS